VEIWQGLIDRKKLPYMACVRNLRNLVLAGIDEEHVNAVCSYLSNEKAVAGSRMFPFRFYSAFDVLDDLDKLYAADMNDDMSATKRRRREKTMEQDDITKAKAKRAKLRRRQNQMNDKAIQPFRRALEKAVTVATKQNIPPMKGRALVAVAVGSDTCGQFGGAKGLVRKGTTVRDAAVLFGLMAKVSAEECRMVCYGRHGQYEVKKLTADSLLGGVKEVVELTSSLQTTKSSTQALLTVLNRTLEEKEWLDSLLWLPGEDVSDDDDPIATWVKQYRHLVNADFIFATVKLTTQRGNMEDHGESKHPNDVVATGFSETVFHCLANLMRGNGGGQVEAVEAADRRHGLAPPARRAFSHAPLSDAEEDSSATRQRGGWRRIRVFLSSTFADMHGERDVVNRYVMPALRRHCRPLRLDVEAVDLRWGVLKDGRGNLQDDDDFLASFVGGPKTDGRAQMLACLREADASDFFVGILGGRRGWKPRLDVSSLSEDAERGCAVAKELVDRLRAKLSDEDLAELKNMSMTELEFALYGFRDPSRALFFVRGEETLRANLDRRVEHVFFPDEDHERLDSLKNRVKKSGSVVHNYDASYGGIIGGKPVASALEDMGKHLFDDLWGRFQWWAEDDTPIERGMCREVQEEFCSHLLKDDFVARPKITDAVIKAAEDIGEEKGIVEVNGKEGAGATSLMVKVYRRLSNTAKKNGLVVLPYFVDSSDDKSYSTFLRYLATELGKLTGGGSSQYEGNNKSLCVKVASSILLASDVMYNSGKKPGRLIIVADGLEEVKGSPHSEEWLPPALPKGLTLITSTRAGSAWQKLLQQRREKRHALIRLPALDIPERKTIVQRHLARMGKKLDESAFNNEMGVIVSKRDAGNAGYLRLLASEISSYGLFESLGQKLSAAGNTTAELLEQILARLEEEVDATAVSNAAVLLAVSKQSGGGLTERTLGEALNCLAILAEDRNAAKMSVEELFDSLPDRNMELSVPAVRMSLVVNGLDSFLEPTEQSLLAGVMIVKGGPWEAAIKDRYLGGSTGAKREEMAHKALAAAAKVALAEGADPLSLDALPFHLAKLGAVKEMERSMCDLKYLRACADFKLLGRLLHHLEGAYLLSRSAREKLTSSTAAKDYTAFIRLNKATLEERPRLTLQLALTEPASSSVYHYGSAWLGMKGAKKSATPILFSPKNKDALATDRPLLAPRVVSSPVSCAIVEKSPMLRPEELLLAQGHRDGSISVSLAHNGESLFSLVGHAAPVTALAFLPGGANGKTSSKNAFVKVKKLFPTSQVRLAWPADRPTAPCRSGP